MEEARDTLEGAVAGYAPDDEERSSTLGPYAALIGLFNGAALATALAIRSSRAEVPQRVAAQDLALLGVATFKLSRLVAKDKVTSAVRAPFTRYQEKGGPAELEEEARGTGVRRALGELVLCPYCLDQWVAGGFLGGLVFRPRATRLVASLFAVTALADFLQVAYKASEEKL